MRRTRKNSGFRKMGRVLLAGLGVLLVGGVGAFAGPQSSETPPLTAESGDPALAVAQPAAPEEDRRRWFFLASLVNVYPRLEREQLIKEYFDPLVNVLAPGSDGVTTFTDMRDAHLLCPPQFAFGYLLSDHFALSSHFGYSEGNVHTKSSDISLLLLPLYVDFKIRRSALYVGLDLDYYPLGAVESRDYKGVADCLKHAKPSLGARLTWTNAGFAARVRVGLWPVKELVKIRLSDTWGIPSLNLNAGVDIPVSKNSVIALNAGYNFFQEEKQDFNGSAYTVAWRYFFR